MMIFTWALNALIFRAAFMLLDVTALFLLIRIVCEARPKAFLQAFNHLGKPLTDGVVELVQRTGRRMGVTRLLPIHACVLALALLCVLQITVVSVIAR